MVQDVTRKCVRIMRHIRIKEAYELTRSHCTRICEGIELFSNLEFISIDLITQRVGLTSDNKD